MNYQVIANYFLSFANTTGDLLTNLKLQKLVYYAQAWNLAIVGESLFSEDFEAWVHGPVLRDLYTSYKEFGSNPIVDAKLDEKYHNELHSSFSDKTQLILNDIKEVYFPKTAYYLEQMTHEEEPWLRARQGLQPYEPSNKIIEKQWMKNFYMNMLETSDKKN